MRIRNTIRVAVVWALSLGWLVPAWLGFSALYAGMRHRGPMAKEDYAHAVSCILLMRTWFLAAVGFWLFFALCVAFRLVAGRWRRCQPSR